MRRALWAVFLNHNSIMSWQSSGCIKDAAPQYLFQLTKHNSAVSPVQGEWRWWAQEEHRKTESFLPPCSILTSYIHPQTGSHCNLPATLYHVSPLPMMVRRHCSCGSKTRGRHGLNSSNFKVKWWYFLNIFYIYKFFSKSKYCCSLNFWQGTVWIRCVFWSSGVLSNNTTQRY